MVDCTYLCNPKGNCQEVKTLDKYEYNLKLDEIKKLVTSGNYEEAVKVADTVEWKRVRTTRTLCMVSEIYGSKFFSLYLGSGSFTLRLSGLYSIFPDIYLLR